MSRGTNPNKIRNPGQRNSIYRLREGQKPANTNPVHLRFTGRYSPPTRLRQAAEPQERKGAADQHDEDARPGQNWSDFHLFWLDHQLGIEPLVNGAQVAFSAGMEIRAAG